MSRCSRRSTEAGFTLLEMLVVIALLGLLLGAAALTISNVTKADLRSSAVRTANLIRFAFNRARMRGTYMRVTFDFKKRVMWLEESEDRVTLRKGREQHATDDASERAPKAAAAPAPSAIPMGLLPGSEDDEGEDGEDSLGIDTAALKQAYEADLSPVERAKTLFKRVPVLGKKLIKLRKAIAFVSVMTPRMDEPAEEGKAYIYFFPEGRAEPAIVHLMNRAEDIYSVVLHPLTGRAKLYPCDYEIPTQFGISDDEKKRGMAGGRCGEEGAL